jgi:hypothetical protein
MSHISLPPTKELIEVTGAAIFKDLQAYVLLRNKTKKSALLYEQYVQDNALPPNLRHKLESNTWARGLNPLLTTNSDELEQDLWRDTLRQILIIRKDTLNTAVTTLQNDLQRFLEESTILHYYVLRLPQLAIYPDLHSDIVLSFQSVARDLIDRPIVYLRSQHSSRDILDDDEMTTEENTTQRPTQSEAQTVTAQRASSSSSSSSSSSTTPTTTTTTPTTVPPRQRRQALTLESLQKTIADLAEKVNTLVKNDSGSLSVNQRHPAPKTRATSPHRESNKKKVTPTTLPSTVTTQLTPTDTPRFFGIPSPLQHFGQPVPPFPFAFQQQLQQPTPAFTPQFLPQHQQQQYNSFQHHYPFHYEQPHYPAFRPPLPPYPALTSNGPPVIGKKKGYQKPGKSSQSVRFSN